MQFVQDSQFNMNDSYSYNLPVNYDIPDTTVCSALMSGMYRCNPVKSLKFDPFEEVLWSISCFGNLCGYHDVNMNIIVSVETPRLVKSNDDTPYELLDLLVAPRPDERILYLLNPQEIVLYTKMGILLDRFSDPMWIERNGLSSFCHHPLDSNQLIIGTTNGDIIQYDIEKKCAVSEYRLPPNDTKSIDKGIGVQRLLNNNRGGLLACFMNGGGTIASIDLRTSMNLFCQFTPHLDTLSDFTVNKQGHAVVSCGTHIQHTHSVPDPYLQVYDLRYRKAQCPIRTETKPGFVRFMPVFNDSMLISTASGFYQVANFGQNCLIPPLYQASLFDGYDYVQCIDISSSGCLVAFGTAEGVVSLSSASKTSELDHSIPSVLDEHDSNNTNNNNQQIHRINTTSRPTPLPTIPAYMEIEPVKFDDLNFVISSSQFCTKPLNQDKFTTLSSDWPDHLCKNKHAQFKPVDMSLFKEYPSKFKKELIGSKPNNWGPVWFPY